MNALRVGQLTPAALTPSMNVLALSQPTAVIWLSTALGASLVIHFLKSS